MLRKNDTLAEKSQDILIIKRKITCSTMNSTIFAMAVVAIAATLALAPILSMTDAFAIHREGRDNPHYPNTKTSTETEDNPKPNKRGNQDTGLIEETTTTTTLSCDEGHGVNDNDNCTNHPQTQEFEPEEETTTQCQVKNKDGDYPEGQNKEGKGC